MTRTEALALRQKVVDGETHEALRPYIEKAAESLDDNDAANAVKLFPNWSEHIGEAVVSGQRMSDTDGNGVLRLYKVREDKGHTTQADWAPHLTPDLWVAIDVAHSGTIDDPIPASRGMEYEYGKYYKDPEDTKLYLCERIGEQSGNKITLQYLPHELVGNYFTLVEGTAAQSVEDDYAIPHISKK